MQLWVMTLVLRLAKQILQLNYCSRILRCQCCDCKSHTHWAVCRIPQFSPTSSTSSLESSIISVAKCHINFQKKQAFHNTRFHLWFPQCRHSPCSPLSNSHSLYMTGMTSKYEVTKRLGPSEEKELAILWSWGLRVHTRTFTELEKENWIMLYIKLVSSTSIGNRLLDSAELVVGPPLLFFPCSQAIWEHIMILWRSCCCCCCVVRSYSLLFVSD